MTELELAQQMKKIREEFAAIRAHIGMIRRITQTDLDRAAHLTRQ